MPPIGGSASEEGLLEYLEDIIGTARYKEPIAESFVRFEELNEARGTQMNRLRLVEKDKAALKKGKQEAEQYLRLKNEETRAKSRLYQFFLWGCFKDEEKHRAQEATLTEELEAEREKNQADVSHLEELEKHFATTETTYQVSTFMNRLPPILTLICRKFLRRPNEPSKIWLSRRSS
jgi:structural maintenance of chromosome 4